MSSTRPPMTQKGSERLRAERGTVDRTYKVTYRVMDLAGNSSLATATVAVKKPK